MAKKTRSRKSPLPGHPVRGSHTGRPLMALFDLLGRRWTLRLLWELRDGPLRFRELRARADDLSPSILNRRMGELRAAAIVESRKDTGYSLTDDGRLLLDSLSPLHGWSRRWERKIRGKRKA